MTSIAELLREYSKENAEIEADETPNSEETTDVLEEVFEDEVDLDEEEGAVLSEESAQLHDSVDALYDATFSLENSVNFLEELRKTSNITDTSIAIFNASIVESLEARKIPVEFLGDEIVFSAEDASKGEEKKQGFFRRLWEMIKRAFQRMREWVMRFLAWFRKSGSAVKAAAEKLKERVQEKKKADAKADNRKFNAAPFIDLSTGGKVDGVVAIGQVASFALAVSASSADVLQTSIDLAKKMESEKDSFFKRVQDFITRAKTDYAGSLRSLLAGANGLMLPGARKMITEVDEAKKGFKVKVKVVTPNKPAKISERWQDVASLNDIEKMANEIIKLVDFVDSATSSYEKLSSSSNFGDMKKYELNVDSSHGSSTEQVREVTSLIVQGNVVSQKLMSTLGKIVFPIAKRIYVFGAINLRQYK